MSWTVLRVTDRGVVLRRLHRARFQRCGAQVLSAFDAFCAESMPGIYSLRLDGDRLTVESRSAPSLFEGMPVRMKPSPLVDGLGPIAKPPPPGPYDAVRLRGTCTLLTDRSGDEIYEACVASAVAWDGERLVLAPWDRPRVLSTSEMAIRESLPFVERPLLTLERQPLAVVNAVSALVRVDVRDRGPFPVAAVRQVNELFGALTER